MLFSGLCMRLFLMRGFCRDWVTVFIAAVSIFHQKIMFGRDGVYPILPIETQTLKSSPSVTDRSDLFYGYGEDGRLRFLGEQVGQ